MQMPWHKHACTVFATASLNVCISWLQASKPPLCPAPRLAGLPGPGATPVRNTTRDLFTIYLFAAPWPVCLGSSRACNDRAGRRVVAGGGMRSCSCTSWLFGPHFPACPVWRAGPVSLGPPLREGGSVPVGGPATVQGLGLFYTRTVLHTCMRRLL